MYAEIELRRICESETENKGKIIMRKKTRRIPALPFGRKQHGRHTTPGIGAFEIVVSSHSLETDCSLIGLLHKLIDGVLGVASILSKAEVKLSPDILLYLDKIPSKVPQTFKKAIVR
jgi:hypothetical protein